MRESLRQFYRNGSDCSLWGIFRGSGTYLEPRPAPCHCIGPLPWLPLYRHMHHLFIFGQLYNHLTRTLAHSLSRYRGTCALARQRYNQRNRCVQYSHHTSLPEDDLSFSALMHAEHHAPMQSIPGNICSCNATTSLRGKAEVQPPNTILALLFIA